jgi:hypothetical protein
VTINGGKKSDGNEHSRPAPSAGAGAGAGSGSGSGSGLANKYGKPGRTTEECYGPTKTTTAFPLPPVQDARVSNTRTTASASAPG